MDIWDKCIFSRSENLIHTTECQKSRDTNELPCITEICCGASDHISHTKTMTFKLVWLIRIVYKDSVNPNHNWNADIYNDFDTTKVIVTKDIFETMACAKSRRNVALCHKVDNFGL